MTDKLKESVSALIDGEASEIEVHRLLRQLDTDTTVKPAWINYLQVRAVIQGEPRVSVARHLELHARISRAIDDEEAYRLGPGRRMPVLRTFAKPIAGLAVAASLAMAVMVGYYVQSPGSAGAPAAGEVASSTPVTVAPQAINAEPVSTAQPDDFQTQPLDLRQLDEQQQRQLRQYLNMHDQMARMDRNAQMVIFENPSSDQ